MYHILYLHVCTCTYSFSAVATCTWFRCVCVSIAVSSCLMTGWRGCTTHVSTGDPPLWTRSTTQRHTPMLMSQLVSEHLYMYMYMYM